MVLWQLKQLPLQLGSISNQVLHLGQAWEVCPEFGEGESERGYLQEGHCKGEFSTCTGKELLI